MNINEIEKILRETVPVVLAQFPASRSRPTALIERLDKKQIRPGSMQMNRETVKVGFMVGDHRPYLLYVAASETIIEKVAYNGLTGRATRLDSTPRPAGSLTAVHIQMDLAEFAATILGPLAG